MFIEILKYGFLVIFFATAVIGIASIPEWIKIPEWYRKRIFYALILEVVGVILILFNQQFIKGGSSGVPEVIVANENWIAFDETGAIIRPEITIQTEDTTIIKQLGKEDHSEFKNLKAEMRENELCIKNADEISIGNIKSSDLKNCGLFNSFKTAKDEISSRENYSQVKWHKDAENHWKKRGACIAPFELEVADYAEGTYYRIINTKTGTDVFDSRESSKNLFSVDNRIVHFYEFENIYYLLRINGADLSGDSKFINVFNIRMEPTLVHKQG